MNKSGERLRAAWNDERSSAVQSRRAGDPEQEWCHLERAHILSQPMPGAHVRTHWAMLAFALRRRDKREFAGQVMRLMIAGPGSITGRYPTGNTGGANVSALAPMAIPDDLAALLEASGFAVKQ